MADVANTFLITPDNSFVHPYRDLDLTNPKKLKDDNGINELLTGIELIDTDGNVITFGFSKDWIVQSLHRTGEQVSPTALRRRLRIWRDSLLEKVEPARVAETYAAVKDKLNPRLPTVEAFELTVRRGVPRFGDQPLAECFERVHKAMYPRVNPDSGSPLHNLSHIIR